MITRRTQWVYFIYIRIHKGVRARFKNIRRNTRLDVGAGFRMKMEKTSNLLIAVAVGVYHHLSSK